MSKLTINPNDVIDLKTPIYKEDKEKKKVYQLLPVTTADQVNLNSGINAETAIANLDQKANNATNIASQGLSTANTAIQNINQTNAELVVANQNISEARQFAENATTIATESTSIANQSKDIANNALSIANEAKQAATKLATNTQNGLMPATDKALIDTAKEHGQLGDAVFIDANEVDANTVLETGNYYVSLPLDPSLAAYTDNHWPYTVAGGTTGYYLKVETNGNTIQQTLQHEYITICRKATNVQGSYWQRWRLKFRPSSGIDIYLSKNGNDDNLGLVPEFPILTVNRALEIVNSISFTSSTPRVNFRFGAGDWGSITFAHLPYEVGISAYDGALHTEYSEELPVFGLLSINNGYGYIKNIVCSSLEGLFGGIIYVEKGYKSIGRLLFTDNSYCYFANVNEATNIWEIKNKNTTSTIISCLYNSHIYMDYLHIKLSQNTANNFIGLNINSTLHVSNQHTIFDPTEYSCTGLKLNMNTDASITTEEAPGVLTWIDKLPCTGNTNITKSTFINGISNAAVNKTGDTMTGYLDFKSSQQEWNVTPSAQISNTMLRAVDKNSTSIASINCVQRTNGNNDLNIAVRSQQGVVKFFVFQVDTNNQMKLVLDSPPLSDNGGSVPNTLWVNQKLGASASLTALANLNESSDDYVETLETKKYKIIANINTEAQQAIYSGFMYEIEGQEYHFDYGLFDQQNLTDLAILALQDNEGIYQIPCINEDGEKVYLNVAANIILEVQKFGFINKQNILKWSQEKKNRIMAAQDETEIQSIYTE